MAREWKQTTLGEITDRITKGTTPSASARSLDSDGINYIRVDCLSDDGGFFVEKFQSITPEANESLKRSQIRTGDILFTIAGTIGRVAIAKPNILPANTNQAIAIIRPNPTVVEARYLAYRLRWSDFTRHALTRVVQSVQANMSLGELRDAHIELPPLEEQRAIAAVLGALDDKIDLNRCTNETLAAMARAIFKSWFIDFDPVRAKAGGEQPWGMDAATAALFPDTFDDSELGDVPQGWRVVVMADLCDLALGGDWGRDSAFDDAVEVYCLRGVDLEHLRASGYADAPRRWLKPTSVSRRKLDDRDILVAGSGVGPIGRSLWVARELESTYGLPVTYSNFCKRFRCRSSATAIYVDRWLQLMRESKEIWEYVNGTSIPNLDANGLLTGKRLIVPPDDILDAFERIVRPVVSRLYARESGTLAELRDTLLPKLLSGEVRVGAAEKILEAAT